MTIVASMGARHQVQHAHALRAGLQRHGIRAEVVPRHTAVATRHVGCWGWRVGQQHRNDGREVCVMERGYLGDRFAWASLGWNGLNGRAQFGRWDDGGRRFDQHWGHLLQPWSTGGDYVLLIGQVPNDAALQGRDLRPWYARQAQRAAALYGLPVRFRPHPLAQRRAAPFVVPGAPELKGELQDALARAALVVTFNSNTAVDALLSGRPTVATDVGSMAWDVALADLPASLDVWEPKRAPWLAALAWRQFSIPEIESGAAWDIVGSVRRGADREG